MNYNDFDWGNTDSAYVQLFIEENFIERTYEKLYTIKENDIVLDIGANFGSFSYSLKDSKPKHIYCLEPSNNIIDTLKKNLNDLPCTIINKGISNKDSDSAQIESGVDYIYNTKGNLSLRFHSEL